MWLHMAGNFIGQQCVFVLAKLVSIRDKLFYPCCTKCRKKLHIQCDDESEFKNVESVSKNIDSEVYSP